MSEQGSRHQDRRTTFGQSTRRAFGAPWRALKALRDPEARRGAALLLLAGSGVSNTGIAVYALVLVQQHARYAFYIGIGALLLIAVVQTGIAALLVKRNIRGSMFGNSFEISDEQVEQIARVSAAAGVAAAAATQVGAAAQ
jgi:hypothetical protein